ncbi:multicopper oxidase domain-containing protein [Spongiactinospora sp. TRM90649]|uniref:multicopper oxidase domain-containing protein n=1 Tax=Spongiactinospora sp. TRM90649 TaxID=3031114 RepID=UPI0023F87FB5|nr:multicopper oxidase domain-containing protein [Spongiactinospora sp. TRM90649]MDF5755582.1 multicopper oxidase domain-containing protein [Spongiactinospora sp. TRM90649]
MRAFLLPFLIATALAAQLVPAHSSVRAADVSIDLCVTAGTLPLPGAANADVWGFSRSDGECAGAAPSVPGPVLTVDQGDAVSLTIRNTLATPVTLEIPGIAVRGGPRITAPGGGTATATFTAAAPGTYLYQGVERQLPMGLYGALVVRPPTPGRAYEQASTAYDREAVLVLSAVDPAFNAAPATADLSGYAPTHWLINGKAYPETAPVRGGAPGSRLLVRYLNAGFDHTSMRLLGAYARVLARDAFPLAAPFDATSETIAAGATEDVLITMPDGRLALYNRQLHLANGGTAPGGMMTFVEPS